MYDQNFDKENIMDELESVREELHELVRRVHNVTSLCGDAVSLYEIRQWDAQLNTIIQDVRCIDTESCEWCGEVFDRDHHAAILCDNGETFCSAGCKRENDADEQAQRENARLDARDRAIDMRRS